MDVKGNKKMVFLFRGGWGVWIQNKNVKGVKKWYSQFIKKSWTETKNNKEDKSNNTNNDKNIVKRNNEENKWDKYSTPFTRCFTIQITKTL